MNVSELKAQIQDMKTLIHELNNTINAAYDLIGELESKLSAVETRRQTQHRIIEVA